jgi:hypothetical protein
VRGPREVSPLARVAVLLGGFASQFGTGWLVLGSVLLWVLGPACDWRGLLPGERATASVPGTFEGESATHFSEGGSKHRRGTPVFAVRYSYEVEGRRYEGTSYRVGGGRAGPVVVDYEVDAPARSRIRGLRPAPFPAAFVLFLFFFPAVGLGVILAGAPTRWRAHGLLASGALARGRVVKQEPTNTRVNRQPVVKYTFEFEAGGTVHHAILRTHAAAAVLDEERERILYDPQRPERAVVVDSLPGGIRIEPGAVACDRPWKALACLLLPGMFLAANALGAALRTGL